MPGRVIINVTDKTHVGIKPDVFQSLGNKMISQLYPELLDSGDIEISVVFIDDKEIAKINAEYRKKDEPTDVLSFSYLQDLLNKKTADKQLGQLFIGSDTLKQQAKAFKHKNSDEAKVLFVHGLLHILGYDHMANEDKNQMLELEASFLVDKPGLTRRALIE